MIFIHSSFRVSSTWLWSRFREAEKSWAYCEIFNESLATITAQEAGTLSPANWDSKHPETAPYYLEYLPLLNESGGVALYDPSMAYERSIPADGPDGDISAEERDYIASLIGQATKVGKVPVLTATRSLGRAVGIKRAFPGFHIVLYRNMFQQWCSYMWYLDRGNSYFLNAVKQMIEGSPHDPFMRLLRDLWPFDPTVDSGSRRFLAFAALHAYFYAHAVNAADLVIDVNRLAAEPEYRRGIEATIRKETGLVVDLSGARNKLEACMSALPPPELLRQTLQPVLDNCLSHAPNNEGGRFAMRAIDEMFREQANFNHYTSSVFAELNQVRAERDRVSADMMSVSEALIHARAECDRLAAEAASIAEALTHLRAEQERLQAESSSVSKELLRICAESDRLKAERDRVAAAQDSLTAELEQIFASRSWKLTAPLRRFNALRHGKRGPLAS